MLLSLFYIYTHIFIFLELLEFVGSHNTIIDTYICIYIYILENDGHVFEFNQFPQENTIF